MAASTASYSGGAGVLVKGPSGVVTGHGPIGPTGPAHGDGFFYGAFGGFPGTGYGAAVIGTVTEFFRQVCHLFYSSSIWGKISIWQLSLFSFVSFAILLYSIGS